MAGNIARAFGAILLVIGILGILSGIAGAAFSYLDEGDNQEQLLADPERSEANEQILVASAVAGVVGVLLLIVGLVLIGVGAGQSRRDRERALQASLAGGPQGASDRGAPDTPESAADTPAPARESETGRTRGFVVAATVAAVLLALAIIGIAFAGGDNSAADLFSSRGSAEAPLAEDQFSGQVQGADMVLFPVNPDPERRHVVEFSAHPDAGSITVNVTWQPGDMGAEELQVSFEQETSGGWSTLDTQTGASPLVFEHAAASVAGGSFRVIAFAAGSSAAQQDFTVNVQSWSA